MAEKETKLSIVIRTVDQATAKTNAIVGRFDKLTKPVSEFRKALGELRDRTGLDDVIGGVRGVHGAVLELLGKVAVFGGVLTGAVFGLKALVDGFDDLGDKAEHLQVGVDFLASMRFAAERAGASADALDQGLQNLAQGIGQAKANTGKLAAFLGKVSPALLRQLKATSSNEEAFRLLANAMVKIKDPAKRLAFAQKTIGDSALAPLLLKGAKGIEELQKRYLELAGSQEAAAAKASDVDDAFKELHASTDGIKAALVTGLAPALKIVVDKLRDWFVAHRADIAAWAAQVGERLPGAIASVVDWLGRAWDKVTAFVDAIGGLKSAAIAAGVILAGPLIGSVVSLTGALVGAISKVGTLGAAMQALPGAGALATGAGGALAAIPGIGAAVVGAEILNQATGGPFDVRAAAKQLAAEENGTPVADVIARSRASIEAARASMVQGAAPVTADVLTQLTAAIRTIADRGAGDAKIKIDIAGAPRGTRVSTDAPRAAVDMSVGYQLIPGIP